jgi:sugar lactone lactonase YvrE
MTAAVTSGWSSFGPAMELGEGARWIADALLHVDLLVGRLYSSDPGASETRVMTSLGIPLGVVAPIAGRPGHWIAAAGTGIAVLNPNDTVDWIARPEESTSAPTRMNDGACDPFGRFWAGSMGYDPSPATGALYRVDTDLTVTQVLDGIAIPNGPAFDAAGTVMYLADSAQGLIYRYELTDDGNLADRHQFASVDGSPDGMTVDAEDHVWSAIWGSGVVHRYAPSGELVEVVPVPAVQPTSIAMGGRRIMVTSATHGLAHPTAHDGRTFIADCSLDGTPTAAFRPLPP